MPLGANIRALFNTNGGYVTPISGTSPWQQVIDPGGMDDTDGSGNPRNPDLQITDDDHHMLDRAALRAGTTVLFRLGYDSGLTGITDPVVRVFGKFDINNPAEAWTMLPDMNGATDHVMATAANDVTDGVLNYTLPIAVDGLGFNFFVWGVVTALAGTGNVTNAVLQAKLI